MFMGHFGLAFGAKKAAPMVSLGTLFAACQFADLLWPTLLLLGYERVEIQAGATTMTPLNFERTSATIAFAESIPRASSAPWPATAPRAFPVMAGPQPRPP